MRKLRKIAMLSALSLAVLGGLSAPTLVATAGENSFATTSVLLASPGHDHSHDGHDHSHEGHNHSHEGEGSETADPKLQQVVKDEEKIDLKTPVVVDHGHIDMGPRILDDKWTFVARDDSVIPPTWRALDRMVFKLSDKALEEIPANTDYSFTGLKPGEKGWVIPQTEKTNVVWLGWSTQSPAVVKNVNGQVKLTFEGHQGPGQLSVFIQDGNFSAPQQLWNSTRPEAQALNVDVNTHTHVNWVFTKPGIHLVRVSASAELKDGKKVTDTRIMRFAVGDKADPQQALNTKWQGKETPKEAQVADTSVTETRESGLKTVLYTGIGLLALAVGAGVVAFFVLRRGKNAKKAALEEQN